jgi:hypothetical protein
MLVIIDEREIVTSGYTSRFGSEGVASAGFRPVEFQEWVVTAADADLFAVEAFLLGDCRDRQLYPKLIKERSHAPVIAMNETPSLEQTLVYLRLELTTWCANRSMFAKSSQGSGPSGAVTSTNRTVR